MSFLGSSTECSEDHSFDRRICIDVNQLNFWMLPLENAENFIGESLTDRLDTRKIQNHFFELFKSRQHSFCL